MRHSKFTADPLLACLYRTGPTAIRLSEKESYAKISVETEMMFEKSVGRSYERVLPDLQTPV